MEYDAETLALRAKHGIPGAEDRLARARESDFGRALGDWSDEHKAAYEDLEKRVFAAADERAS